MAKKTESSPAPRKTQTVQENMEDKTFSTLIRRYTRKRDWTFVQALFNDYGRVLEDRAKSPSTPA